MANSDVFKDYVGGGSSWRSSGGNDESPRARRKRILDEISKNPEYAQHLIDNPDQVKQLIGHDPLLEKFFHSANIPRALKNYKFTPEQSNLLAEKKRMAQYGTIERGEASDAANMAARSIGIIGDLPPITLESISGNDPKKGQELRDQYDSYISNQLNRSSKVDIANKVAQTNESSSRSAIQKEELKRQKDAKLIADAAAVKYGKHGLWQAIKKGRTTPQEANALYTIESYQRQIRDEQELDLESERVSARLRGDSESSINALARQMALKTKTPVAPELIVKILKDQKLARRLVETPEKDVKPEERDFWEAAQVRVKYMRLEGREMNKEAIANFKTLFPRLGAVQARQIPADDALVAEMNNAALQAWDPDNTGMEPPTFAAGFIDIPYGGDKSVILRVGGEAGSYVNPANSYVKIDGKKVKVSIDGKIEEAETPAKKSARFEALGNKYPNESDEQIKARVEKGEKP
jgi:hypothetical protein